jgi:hypothetical protein
MVVKSSEISQEDMTRLEEIMGEIKDLVEEAKGIFKPTTEWDRFYSYPYAHIMGALDNDGPFVGGSFITMQDCIDKLDIIQDWVDKDEDES